MRISAHQPRPFRWMRNQGTSMALSNAMALMPRTAARERASLVDGELAIWLVIAASGARWTTNKAPQARRARRCQRRDSALLFSPNACTGLNKFFPRASFFRCYINSVCHRTTPAHESLGKISIDNERPNTSALLYGKKKTEGVPSVSCLFVESIYSPLRRDRNLPFSPPGNSSDGDSGQGTKQAWFRHAGDE